VYGKEDPLKNIGLTYASSPIGRGEVGHSKSKLKVGREEVGHSKSKLKV
jgi:hypothetical protein